MLERSASHGGTQAGALLEWNRHSLYWALYYLGKQYWHEQSHWLPINGVTVPAMANAARQQQQRQQRPAGSLLQRIRPSSFSALRSPNGYDKPKMSTEEHLETYLLLCEIGQDEDDCQDFHNDKKYHAWFTFPLTIDGWAVELTVDFYVQHLGHEKFQVRVKLSMPGWSSKELLGWMVGCSIEHPSLNGQPMPRLHFDPSVTCKGETTVKLVHLAREISYTRDGPCISWERNGEWRWWWKKVALHVDVSKRLRVPMPPGNRQPSATTVVCELGDERFQCQDFERVPELQCHFTFPMAAAAHQLRLHADLLVCHRSMTVQDIGNTITPGTESDFQARLTLTVPDWPTELNGWTMTCEVIQRKYRVGRWRLDPSMGPNEYNISLWQLAVKSDIPGVEWHWKHPQLLLRLQLHEPRQLHPGAGFESSAKWKSLFTKWKSSLHVDDPSVSPEQRAQMRRRAPRPRPRSRLFESQQPSTVPRPTNRRLSASHLYQEQQRIDSTTSDDRRSSTSLNTAPPERSSSDRSIVNTTSRSSELATAATTASGSSSQPASPLVSRTNIDKPTNPSPASERQPTNTSPASERQERASRPQSQFEVLECPICVDAPVDTVFTCGHTSCGQCARALHRCHVCRRIVFQRIPLYL